MRRDWGRGREREREREREIERKREGERGRDGKRERERKRRDRKNERTNCRAVAAWRRQPRGLSPSHIMWGWGGDKGKVNLLGISQHIQLFSVAKQIDTRTSPYSGLVAGKLIRVQTPLKRQPEAKRRRRWAKDCNARGDGDKGWSRVCAPFS